MISNLVWKFCGREKSLSPSGNRTPDRLAHSPNALATELSASNHINKEINKKNSKKNSKFNE